MTNGKTVLESVIPAVSKSNGDYYGKDGLLYCGKCHTPKEAFFAKNLVLMGKNRHPVDCRCRKMEREQQEVAIRQQKHNELVRRLKAGGFLDTAMLDWNFENDDGRAPQMHYAHRYVEQWQTMRAGCIANALMEQEVSVRMTNFARIMNELNNSFPGGM